MFAATNDLTTLLQRGLFEEEANRNLDAAITSYESLAKQFDKDRQLAATAIFRLGECYRKLGKTNEAVLQYERIVREFEDQQTLATLSRQNLIGMGAQLKTAAVPDNPAAAPSLEELELERTEQTMARLRGWDFSQLRRLLPSVLPDADLERQENKLKEAELALDKAEASHASKIETDELAERLDQARHALARRVEEVLDQLYQRRDELKQRTAERQKKPTSRPGEAQMVDDEEKEIRRLQAMIQNSPDLINAPGQGGTPLQSAAGAGWLRVAAFLLNHGADVNLKENGQAPITVASGAGQKAMVEFLLSHNADVNAVDNAGETPLHGAARRGFRAVAEVLLAHKADPNVRNSAANGENTPLHLAAQFGQIEILNLLVVRGADVNARGQDGSTPLADAVSRGKTDSVKALLALKADPNLTDNAGRTPLSSAILRDKFEAAEALVIAGADPNAGTIDLPLSALIERNQSVKKLVLCESLLRHGADPNNVAEVKLGENLQISDSHGVSDKYPLSPIQLAVARGQEEIVKLLLNYKANPNGMGVRGSPLILEANVKVAAVLLAHGADPNATTSKPTWTVLHNAVLQCDRSLVEQLLAKKAEVNVRSWNGETPLDVARRLAKERPVQQDLYKGIIDLLGQHGALDELPDFTSIRFTRQGLNQPIVVFRQNTNGWNRFTLLETLLRFYSERDRVRMVNLEPRALPFPHLTRLIIHRPARLAGNKEQQIKINLLNGTNGIDCSRDISLEFGDVVEIPIREYGLQEMIVGLTEAQRNALFDCLKGKVEVTVRGQRKDVSLSPPQTFLRQALQKSEIQSILLSSSDLSRVTVKRKNPATGQASQFEVNATAGSPVDQDLWLRDGDLIEVPEK